MINFLSRFSTEPQITRNGEMSLTDPRMADVLQNHLMKDFSLREVSLLSETSNDFRAFRSAAMKAEKLMYELKDKEVTWEDIGHCRRLLGSECDSFLPQVLSEVVGSKLGKVGFRDPLQLIRENRCEEIDTLHIASDEISIQGLSEIARRCSKLAFLSLHLEGKKSQEITVEWLREFGETYPSLQQIKLTRLEHSYDVETKSQRLYFLISERPAVTRSSLSVCV